MVSRLQKRFSLNAHASLFKITSTQCMLGYSNHKSTAWSKTTGAGDYALMPATPAFGATSKASQCPMFYFKHLLQRQLVATLS